MADAGGAARRLVVILNATSGYDDKEAIAERLYQLFQSYQADASIHLATTGGHVLDLARQAVIQQPYAIVAGGGDGTVSTIASLLVDTDIALGVLPLGTLNHFARDMRLPFDLMHAARSLVAGHSVQVDVGEVNERIFLNNSSLGLYPRLVWRRQRQQHKLGRGKWPAFAWAALTVARRYAFMTVRIRMGDAEIERRTPFVFIGNNRYAMEGLRIGGRDRLDDGHLMLFMPQDGGRLGLLKLGFRALFGRLHQTKDFDEMVSETLSVHTQQHRPHVAHDGEVTRMSAPLRYRIRRGALRVIVPAPGDPEARD
jgi:diacylglycerol kinase family enzyme